MKNKLLQATIAIVTSFLGMVVSYAAIDGQLVGYSTEQEMVVCLLGIATTYFSLVMFATSAMDYFNESK
jgi:hypothetical protein